MLTGNKAVYRIHGSRTIKRNARDNVLKTGRHQLAKHLLHSSRFKLEYTVCFRLTEKLEGLFIIEIDFCNIKIGCMLSDLLHCIINYGKVAKSEEIKLNESEQRIGVHIKLCNNTGTTV